MRKSIALKTLLRAPVKTILTFLLIGAATFALFSRITDYAITTRESAKAESFYHGVAGLDNSSPMIGYYTPEPNPWPTNEQIEEFSSLPGVTLADTRYTTDGMVENYKRVIEQESSFEENSFVLEGTYDGLEEYDSGSLYISFHDIKVYAGELDFNPDRPLKINAENPDNAYKHSYSREFFYDMKKGSRYLILGTYSEKSGSALELGFLWYYTGEEWFMEKINKEFIQEIDGLEKDYLETEEFADYKEMIDVINQSTSVYDIVYTADMRAIPYVNERKMVIAKGRPLTAEDTDSCVVSNYFLETYGLSIGDKLHIELGDKLLPGQGEFGSRHRTVDMMSNFIASADLEIIGAYEFSNEWIERLNENSWSYGPATIFVPSTLLPVEVPKDYEILMGDFSVFIEDADDLKTFREAAEPMAAEMGLGLRFSDSGWFGMKDNIETGSLASLLAAILYVFGSALALLLAVYLYVGRNKQSYAIMRTLGVTGKKAGFLITLPLGVVSILGILIGGTTGLLYASYTAAKTLANMSDTSAPEGYVYILDGAIPVGVVISCLIFELLFIFFVMMFFLQKMKKTSPLELLQENAITAKRTGILKNHFLSAKHKTEITDTAPIPDGLDIAKLSDVLDHKSLDTRHGTYNAPRQVCAYIFQHMQRGLGKTVVSLILTIVLAGGIGTFALARLAYQEAYREMDVKGRTMKFVSTYIMDMSNSDMIKDLYYYNLYSVRVNGVGVLSPMTFTNDFDRYLTDDYNVTFAEGYDLSVFEGTGPVCLVGKTLAETLGVRPGDTITLMSEDLYSFMPQIYEEDELEFAIERAGKPYQVAGILESEDADVNAGIFSVVNDAAENLYSQPFPVDYCEFTVADNERIMELNNLLDEQKTKGVQYSNTASFHIDSDLYENTKRIRNLLESLFPIAVAAAVLIGVFGPGLIIIQSAQEAAFLRILGVTKRRARSIMLFEQITLCIAGIVLVAGILAIFSSGLFLRSIDTLSFCWTLYFLGCICGSLTAAIQVTRYKILELLQVKE